MITNINTLNKNINFGTLRIIAKDNCSKRCLNTIYNDAGDLFDTEYRKSIKGKKLYIESTDIHPERAREAEIELFYGLQKDVSNVNLLIAQN